MNQYSVCISLTFIGPMGSCCSPFGNLQLISDLLLQYSPLFNHHQGYLSHSIIVRVCPIAWFSCLLLWSEQRQESWNWKGLCGALRASRSCREWHSAGWAQCAFSCVWFQELIIKFYLLDPYEVSSVGFEDVHTQNKVSVFFFPVLLLLHWIIKWKPHVFLIYWNIWC